MGIMESPNEWFSQIESISYITLGRQVVQGWQGNCVIRASGGRGPSVLSLFCLGFCPRPCGLTCSRVHVPVVAGRAAHSPLWAFQCWRHPFSSHPIGQTQRCLSEMESWRTLLQPHPTWNVLLLRCRERQLLGDNSQPVFKWNLYLFLD